MATAMTMDRSCLDLQNYGPQTNTGQAMSLADAEEYCRKLANSHYENFTVASNLLPKNLHQHFCNVYAYCRWADDLADEVTDPDESCRLLDWWNQQLHQCYSGRADHPVFIALRKTVQTFNIPSTPFADLITAFRRDQTQTRYADAADLLSYCESSANPVGRIVLHLIDCHSAENQRLSDSVCTGLQLANFCQDVARDYVRGRIYLPRESCERFGYFEEDFAAKRYNKAFRDLMRFEVARAETYLKAGKALGRKVPRSVRVPIYLFMYGGFAVLQEIRRNKYNLWRQRPTIGKWKKTRLLIQAWWRAMVL